MASGDNDGIGVGGGRALQLTTEELPDGRLCLRVCGELDLATAEELDHRLAQATNIVLDLGRLTFMDSTGLSALMTASRRMHDAGTTLELVSPLPAQPQRLLELTGVIDRLAFTQDGRPDST